MAPTTRDGSPAATLPAPANARWKHRPTGSTWGDFGPDDQVGRMNLVDEAKVLQGVAEVRVGKSFCLSLPLDYPGGSVLHPSRSAPKITPTVRHGHSYVNYPVNRDVPWATDIVSDDQVLLSLQYSTQWDGLAHVGQVFDVDGTGRPVAVYYNGFRAGSDVVDPSIAGDGLPAARRLGIENMAATCVQGRAVMIDIDAHLGRSGRKVGFAELMDIMNKDAVTVEPGDFICFHTGFARMVLDMGGSPDREALMTRNSALDGRDERLLQWITDSGVVALIADNYAVEALPTTQCGEHDCASLPLHAHCLFKLGVHLGELWHLSGLADWLRGNDRSRFLLTAPPLRLPGALGSPVSPVGTV